MEAEWDWTLTSGSRGFETPQSELNAPSPSSERIRYSPRCTNGWLSMWVVTGRLNLLIGQGVLPNFNQLNTTFFFH